MYTRDDLIIATGQLRRFDDEFAEIGCLVVHPDYQRDGKGDAMLGYLERLCLQDGAKKVGVVLVLVASEASAASEAKRVAVVRGISIAQAPSLTH